MGWLETPIIEDQQIDLAKAAQQAWMAAVSAGEARSSNRRGRS